MWLCSAGSELKARSTTSWSSIRVSTLSKDRSRSRVFSILKTSLERPRRPSHAVYGFVMHQGQEKGQKSATFRVDALGMLPESKERFLHGILCVAVVAEDPVSEPGHPLP